MTTKYPGLTLEQSANSFTDEELEGMAYGNSPQGNACRELLARRQIATKQVAVVAGFLRDAGEFSRPGPVVVTRRAPAVPEGWQLVPVEPDYTMLSADGCKEHAEGQKCLHHDNRRRIWTAMLAAAPKPEGGEE